METIDYEIKFVCLYDLNYAVLNLKLDEFNQLNCSLEHIRRYTLTDPIIPQNDDEEILTGTKDLPKRYDTINDNKIAAALKK